MLLAAYVLVLSALYAIVAVIAPDVAVALTAVYVPAIVCPAIYDWRGASRKARRRSG
jgi:hypothetical protein